jgi:hypothetical protein
MSETCFFPLSAKRRGDAERSDGRVSKPANALAPMSAGFTHPDYSASERMVDPLYACGVKRVTTVVFHVSNTQGFKPIAMANAAIKAIVMNLASLFKTRF